LDKYFLYFFIKNREYHDWIIFTETAEKLKKLVERRNISKRDIRYIILFLQKIAKGKI